MSGDDLVKEAGGGIIAITLEYRLGIFGSFACSASKSLLITDSRVSRFSPRPRSKAKGCFECRIA